MHWCADETLALLAALPFVGFAFSWVRMKWRAWRGKRQK